MGLLEMKKPLPSAVQSRDNNGVSAAILGAHLIPVNSVVHLGRAWLPKYFLVFENQLYRGDIFRSFR